MGLFCAASGFVRTDSHKKNITLHSNCIRTLSGTWQVGTLKDEMPLTIRLLGHSKVCLEVNSGQNVGRHNGEGTPWKAKPLAENAGKGRPYEKAPNTN